MVTMMEENLRRKITGELYDAKVSGTVRREVVGKVYYQLSIIQLAGSLLYYQTPASFVALAIYDDRLELWNKGGLPPGIEITDLKRFHQSNPRNRLNS